MYLPVLLACLVWNVCSAQESLIDEYVREINDFIANTSSWQQPTDSRAYTQGRNPNQPGVYIGTYDFIIVGAGSSGSVLMNRLSEERQWRILVLEAGDFPTLPTTIPALTEYLRISDFNWGYQSEPQPNISQGYVDRVMKLPRGRVVGGTSVINAMVYARGNRLDFDRWAAMGNPGWDYKSVLPYFRRSETMNGINPDVPYHGHSGELFVENPRVFDEVGAAFLQANRELGRKIVDYNGREQLGSGYLQMNEWNGRRDSAYSAFVRPALNRSNIDFRNQTLVTRILINPNYGNAYGVRYLHNGLMHFALSTREVILCAGVFNTPQLLMLSGVGHRSHLQSLGIRTLVNLPVGDNLWDHLIINTQQFSINRTYNYPDERTLVAQYLRGMGPLTSPGNGQGIAFLNTRGIGDLPDIEHVFHTGRPNILPYEYYRDVHGYTNETYTNVILPTNGRNAWNMHTVLLHPRSRGTVRLRSRSPFDFPVVNLGYFTDPGQRDLETLLRGMRDTVALSQTRALQRYNSTIIRVSLPICEVHPYDSDNFWRCMITNLVETVYHNAGACKMGPGADRTTVVDHNLRVHGLSGLRVADCSVIPVTVSGHLNAVAYMIGERAADIIKNYYRAGRLV